jgi:hypothetical protein
MLFAEDLSVNAFVALKACICDVVVWFEKFCLHSFHIQSGRHAVFSADQRLPIVRVGNLNGTFYQRAALRAAFGIGHITYLTLKELIRLSQLIVSIGQRVVRRFSVFGCGRVPDQRLRAHGALKSIFSQANKGRPLARR